VGGKGGAALGVLAARQMSVADGARIGMIETNGWDTHTGQNYRLAAQLKQLVATIAPFCDGLGTAAWANTVVLVATEFGLGEGGAGRGQREDDRETHATLLFFKRG